MKELTSNRWFVWAIAVVIIAGIALVGYMNVTNENLTNSPESTVYVNQRPSKTPVKTPVKAPVK